MEQPQNMDTSLGGVHTPEQDLAQESLVSALRSSFNVLRVIMVVLLLAYLGSGVFRVQPGEQGVVVRLGKLRTNPDESSPLAGTNVFGPGWHWALPDPFDEKITLTGGTQVLEIGTFSFSRRAEDLQKTLAELQLSSPTQLQPGVDGVMLTGDRNVSHGIWRVQYRIVAGDKFVSNVGESPADFNPLLQRITESAIVAAVASRRVEDVTRGGLADVKAEVWKSVQNELDRLQTGVVISEVLPETIEPGAVREAFLSVSQAENERESRIQEATRESNRILQQAAGPRYEGLLEIIRGYGAAQAAGADAQRLEQMRGEIDARLVEMEGSVAIRLGEAKTRASDTSEAVRREEQQFNYYLELYRRYPEATALQLWSEMRDRILNSRQNEVFMLPPGSDEIEIITNRDPQRGIEAEVERYRSRRAPAGQRPPGGVQ